MLCVYHAIKGPTELVTIVKCVKFYPHRYRYDAAGIKSISPLNPLVTRHRLNDHQRQIAVQGDCDHDLCTGGSYAEATVMLTSTQASRPSNRQ